MAESYSELGCLHTFSCAASFPLNPSPTVDSGPPEPTTCSVCSTTPWPSSAASLSPCATCGCGFPSLWSTDFEPPPLDFVDMPVDLMLMPVLLMAILEGGLPFA